MLSGGNPGGEFAPDNNNNNSSGRGQEKRNKLFMTVAVAAISFALAASVALNAYQTGQIGSLSSELASKSATIEMQDEQIRRHASEIEAQRQELENKSEELQSLYARMDALSSEVSVKEGQIGVLDSALSVKEYELAELRSEAEGLQGEISALEGQIEQGELQIADLSRQLQEDRDGLLLSSSSAKRTKVSHFGLGVSGSGEGVVFPVEVEVIGAGHGVISVDVSNVQYEASFQEAVRTAARVASDHSGVPLADKDIIVRFAHSDAGGEGEEDDVNNGAIVQVDGPSAGAAITGMIIAGLTGKEMDPSVLVTGTIKEDGTVGRVSAIEAKADAAEEHGAIVLLVPKAQEFDGSGIAVVGVSDIEEALKYLIKGD